MMVNEIPDKLTLVLLSKPILPNWNQNGYGRIRGCASYIIHVGIPHPLQRAPYYASHTP